MGTAKRLQPVRHDRCQPAHRTRSLGASPPYEPAELPSASPGETPSIFLHGEQCPGPHTQVHRRSGGNKRSEVISAVRQTRKTLSSHGTVTTTFQGKGCRCCFGTKLEPKSTAGTDTDLSRESRLRHDLQGPLPLPTDSRPSDPRRHAIRVPLRPENSETGNNM